LFASHPEAEGVTKRAFGQAMESLLTGRKITIGEDGPPSTVSVIEANGTATPLADGFWLEGGRYPVLHFTTAPGGRLRIAYQAGYGPMAGAIPADLTLAIADQATRYYAIRGDDVEAAQGLCLSASRIAARYRRVKL
jgi:hypothetical protein